MCCEILEGCSSFHTWKKSCNSTLKFVNFKYSRGLGYCIKGVAGRKATGKKNARQKLEWLLPNSSVGSRPRLGVVTNRAPGAQVKGEVATWTRGVGVATSN